MRVKDLIALLQELPPEAPIWVLRYFSEELAENAFHLGLYMYENGSDVRLVFDDGQATHPNFDQYLKPLMER